jgi:hypothetical protein
MSVTKWLRGGTLNAVTGSDCSGDHYVKMSFCHRVPASGCLAPDHRTGRFADHLALPRTISHSPLPGSAGACLTEPPQTARYTHGRLSPLYSPAHPNANPTSRTRAGRLSVEKPQMRAGLRGRGERLRARPSVSRTQMGLSPTCPPRRACRSIWSQAPPARS